ncbi:BnaA07g04190D [Brassica napus]|uniref:(rape) hypothetical protein n=1 Tax=Brassica napus TaxID=3708 RepID=A0A078HIK2_BRANA|nr:unnamed protein product [Brassica napus]CDY36638.1 BnaA07g04190D [Brassica napus]
MPPKAKSFVSDIKPWKTEWRVHVKAVHSWKQQSKFGGESLEMILADETGAKIHASCKHGFLAKVRRDLPINEWRVIDTFNVSPARGYYRTTAHAYRIAITNDTSIASSDVKIETLFLSLASFTSINNGDLDPDFLIDVFGQVVEIGDMLTVQVSGEERKKCEFYLRDTR